MSRQACGFEFSRQTYFPPAQSQDPTISLWSLKTFYFHSQGVTIRDPSSLFYILPSPIASPLRHMAQINPGFYYSELAKAC